MVTKLGKALGGRRGVVFKCELGGGRGAPEAVMRGD